MIDITNLNDNQQKAVTTTEGAVLVLAGAGSGKTRVLTMRTAHILDMGVPPYAILALTFTNKAANEMKERIQQICPDISKMWVGTFHSICARILRVHIDKIGYDKTFSIYDEGNALSLLKEILPKYNIDPKVLSPKSVKYIISNAKNANVSPAEFANAYPAEENDFELSVVYGEYEKRLKENNALDFDDLLLKTLQLLETCPDVLENYSKRFKYIMIDEYQDTNSVQYGIVRLMSSHHKNLFVVGDDDQSIYSFRGANIRNILEFERDFENVTTIYLEENYRSHQGILDIANKVIANNTKRKAKNLYTSRPKGDIPTEFAAMSEFKEAEFIVRTCSELAQSGESYDDIAILYRTNSQSRVIEDELKRRGMPYRIYGGMGFYDRKEIKDIIAYLNLILNPRADMSFMRIINEPKRGIGSATVAKLSEYAINNGISLMDASRNSESFLGVRLSGVVMKFVALIEQLSGDMDSYSVSQFVDRVLSVSGYFDSLKQEGTPEAQDRLNNLNEFLNMSAQFEVENPEGNLLDFLERSSLISDVDSVGAEQGKISLMTLHSAKGLEFDNVFIAGLENQLLPHSMSGDTGIEEERRLCYVGITRAKKKLFLTHAKSRMSYKRQSSAGFSVETRERSMFLDEIPGEMINYIEDKPPKFDVAQRAERNKRPAVSFAEFRRTQTVSDAKHNSTSNYSIGTNVYHQKFGEGVIKSINGEGKEKIALVDFFDQGEKKMFLAFAPLQIK